MQCNVLCFNVLYCDVCIIYVDIYTYYIYLLYINIKLYIYIYVCVFIYLFIIEQTCLDLLSSMAKLTLLAGCI